MGFWGSKDVEDRAEEILDRRKQPIQSVQIDYAGRLKAITQRLNSDIDDDERETLQNRAAALQKIIDKTAR